MGDAHIIQAKSATWLSKGLLKRARGGGRGPPRFRRPKNPFFWKMWTIFKRALIFATTLLAAEGIYFHVTQGQQRAWAPLLLARPFCTAASNTHPYPQKLHAPSRFGAGCFIEEMPGQTLFLATYSNPDFKPWGTPGASDIAVFVDVLDPSGQPAVPRKVADTAGKVAFHSTAGGEYKMCFSTNGTKWGGDLQKFVRARGRPLPRPPSPPSPPRTTFPPKTLRAHFPTLCAARGLETRRGRERA